MWGCAADNARQKWSTLDWVDLLLVNTNRDNACLSALVDTSGGSDDGFVQARVNSVANAWVYYGTQQLARLARWIGRDADAKILEARAAALASRVVSRESQCRRYNG